MTGVIGYDISEANLCQYRLDIWQYSVQCNNSPSAETEWYRPINFAVRREGSERSRLIACRLSFGQFSGYRQFEDIRRQIANNVVAKCDRQMTCILLS